MSFLSEPVASPTGARIALRVLAPDGPVAGVVHIHHGLSEHAGRYAAFAHRLAAQGIAVGAADHRGHGATEAPDASPGLFAAKGGADLVIADALAVEDVLRARFPGRPLIVFGHSMGGVIAMNHALARQGALEGLAVWNANLALGGRGGLMRAVLALESLWRKPSQPSALLEALTFSAWGTAIKGGRTKFDWLSRDPEAVRAYIDDPLCGQPASISLWRDLVALTERGEDEHRLRAMRTDLPIHLAAGGQDPATDHGRAVKTLAARLYNARFSDVTMRFDPAARHETLNDLGKAEAMEDFAHWALRVFGQAG